MLCGLDYKTGTSWIAINIKTGDLAFLTNYRCDGDAIKTVKFSSRGRLVLDYAMANDDAIPIKNYSSTDDFVKRAFDGKKKYRGFNLVFGNVMTGNFRYIQNQNADPRGPCVLNMDQAVDISKDVCHGMSNGDFNKWQKVHTGRQQMR